jgi:hypothetical protein
MGDVLLFAGTGDPMDREFPDVVGVLAEVALELALAAALLALVALLIQLSKDPSVPVITRKMAIPTSTRTIIIPEPPDV